MTSCGGEGDVRQLYGAVVAGGGRAGLDPVDLGLLESLLGLGLQQRGQVRLRCQERGSEVRFGQDVNIGEEKRLG